MIKYCSYAYSVYKKMKQYLPEKDWIECATNNMEADDELKDTATSERFLNQAKKQCRQ